MLPRVSRLTAVIDQSGKFQQIIDASFQEDMGTMMFHRAEADI